MATLSRRNSKGYSGAGSENGRKGSKEATPDYSISSNTPISAPKYGTVVPERVFVGGISMNMSESELSDFFTKYGKVVDTKIIVDRAGVSKGYGFITFETEEEANKLLADADNIMLRERKLNIAHAIKKQSFSQRYEVPNGTANMVGAPLFGTSLPFPFSNGVTYFCHHPNSSAMTAQQPSTPQPPPPQPAPPAAPATHLDPNLYTGYSGIPAPAPQYHQVVYNPPIYYQAAQYQYPVTACEAVEGTINEASTMAGGSMSTSTPAVGPVMIAPNGYYIQDLSPYQEYTYAHQYIYPHGPDQNQQHHAALMQYSPAAAAPPPPRPLYETPMMSSEHNVSGREVHVTTVQQKHVQTQAHQPLLQHQSTTHGQTHQTLPSHSHHQISHAHHQAQPPPLHAIAPQHPPPHNSNQQQAQPVQKPKESVLPPRTSSKPAPSHNYHHPPDTNNNNQMTSHRPPFPLLHPNPNVLGSQVFPAPQSIYPRPSSSNPSYQHYSTNPFNNNSAGTIFRKYRRPYNPGLKSRGGGRGGGSVSSYSSGGGGGLVTPPSTPRSDQPSPDHPSSQSVSSSAQDHIVHSMKTLKAA